MIKTKWTKDAISEIYHRRLFELIYEAAGVHLLHNKAYEVQISSLVSIKTGGCPEDCAYCPQAARYQTGLKVEKLMTLEEVTEIAAKAKAAGASRLCMGAAWREVRDNSDFEQVLEMVKLVSGMGMEACCTLGMLTYEQAVRLKKAGLYAYNHNLDTSEQYYREIIHTRVYEDRLKTLENVRKAKITVCSGGIIGLGETVEDRVELLAVLANLKEPPESVPINALVPVKGTPLENQQPVSVWDLVRMIATTRIILPKTVVRLSAGRMNLSLAEQALCFLAGANSIFAGDKLLTTPNPSFETDMEMLDLFGLEPKQLIKTNSICKDV